MVHPELPWYDIDRMLQTALPGPKFVPATHYYPRELTRLGMGHTVHLGRLKSTRRLGSGGFGDIFQMSTADKTKVFAVKRIRKLACACSSFVSEMAAHVLMADNASFPTIHGVFHDKHFFFVIMDLGGKSMDKREEKLSRRSPLCYGLQLVSFSPTFDRLHSGYSGPFLSLWALLRFVKTTTNELFRWGSADRTTVEAASSS
ncbi:hypothetical protein MVEN_00824200 [Mycena venus]|uniref:Protein kinase domain-containing protein n=1 Tax=Mycena venus TaxID=2733690 RepID=A0A8H6YEP6_9AGAR|nr:hypothetical protein MVEN_00824200 [Mycena venus]